MQKSIDALNKLRHQEPVVVNPPPVVVRPAVDPLDEVRAVIKGKERQLIFFSIGSSKLSPQALQTVQEVAAYMNGYPSLRLSLKGFTDSSGNPAANLRLSQRRAESVKTALQQMGVGAERISTQYKGEDPSSDSAFGRRVEVQILIQ